MAHTVNELRGKCVLTQEYIDVRTLNLLCITWVLA